jgi:hypothetical protein
MNLSRECPGTWLALVGNTTYDGQDIVVSGCTLTVDGPHAFASLLVTNSGAVTHSTAPNGETNNLVDISMNRLQNLVGLRCCAASGEWRRSSAALPGSCPLRSSNRNRPLSMNRLRGSGRAELLLSLGPKAAQQRRPTGFMVPMGVQSWMSWLSTNDNSKTKQLNTHSMHPL